MVYKIIDRWFYWNKKTATGCPAAVNSLLNPSRILALLLNYLTADVP